MIIALNLMKKKAEQIKKKLSQEQPHKIENWGQAELIKLKEFFDYENYNESCKIYNELSNWIDNRR